MGVDMQTRITHVKCNMWGGYLVGEWAFTEDDDLTHHSYGRVNLWYDFEDDEWPCWCWLRMIGDRTRFQRQSS